jgi:hypothetical protein
MNFLSFCRCISVRLTHLNSHSCYNEHHNCFSRMAQDSYLPSIATKGPLIDLIEDVPVATSILTLELRRAIEMIGNQFPPTTNAMLEWLDW